MSANEHVSNAMDWQHGNEDGHEPSTFALRNAQVEATLALAYEQRTANLLAYLQSVECSNGQTIKINTEVAVTIFTELNERLDRPTQPGAIK